MNGYALGYADTSARGASDLGALGEPVTLTIALIGLLAAGGGVVAAHLKRRAATEERRAAQIARDTILDVSDGAPPAGQSALVKYLPLAVVGVGAALLLGG